MSEFTWRELRIEQLQFLVSQSNENWIVDGDKQTLRSVPKHTRTAPDKREEAKQ